MNYLRASVLLICFIFYSTTIDAQLTGLSGGLAFSTGVDYNTGTTGNPGLFGKTYFKVNKRFHIVPSVTIFNKYERPIFSVVLKTYMFHADVDGVFSLYKNKAISFLGYAGFNSTMIISKWDIIVKTAGSKYYVDKSDLKPGLNLGGALHLYVNDSFDAYIAAKYILSLNDKAESFDEAIISVGTIYYLGGKRRKAAF
jgi:hypothetical protein